MLSIQTRPVITADLLHGAVVITGSVDVSGHEFIALEKSQWTIVKLLGIKDDRQKCTICKTIATLRNDEIARMSSLLVNDGKEDLDIDDKHEGCRAKRLKTVFDTSSMPPFITIVAPAFENIPSIEMKVMTASSTSATAWVELTEEVVDYLHSVAQYQKTHGDAVEDEVGVDDDVDMAEAEVMKHTSPVKHVFYSPFHKAWIVRWSDKDDDTPNDKTKQIRCAEVCDVETTRVAAERFKPQLHKGD